MKRILITGSRYWANRAVIGAALALQFNLDDTAVLVSGACPTGADAIAEGIWEGLGGIVERHPADWGAHGKAAGPIRNQKMVDLGADICLAVPLGESRGTRHCMKVAEAAGISVLNYGDWVA